MLKWDCYRDLHMNLHRIEYNEPGLFFGYHMFSFIFRRFALYYFKRNRLLCQASMHCLRESLVPEVGRVTEAVSLHTSPSAQPHLCRSYRENNVMCYPQH